MKYTGFSPIVLGFLLGASSALSAKVTNPSKVPKKAVLLSKVSSLTLRSGQNTASRRVSPVPQLQCVGPESICRLYEVDTMRCTNEGADYDVENIQWSCKANLPEEFKLGGTDVGCEGYESSDDPYVLKGSCGVEYRLLLTDKGEEKFGDIGKSDGNEHHNNGSGGQLFSLIFMLAFFGILALIAVSCIKSWQERNAGNNNNRPGWGLGGGGGGGGNDDPPPPYDSHYSPPPAKKPNTRTYAPRTSTSTRTSPRSSSNRTAPTAEGWRPGFWTGTAAGAAAGYLAGNRNQTPAQTQAQTETRQTGGGLFGGGGNSWLGRNTGARRGPDPPVQRNYGSSSSTSTPSFSSTRHESTGFGSTSRR